MTARRGTTVEEDREGAEEAGVNEVRLVGRVSGEPETRTMPSGDEVVLLRVVVRRPAEAAARSVGTRAAKTGKAAKAAKAAKAVVAGTDDPPVHTPPRPTVDTIDVSCWTAVTRRAGLRLTAGDAVEVEGALRRRFYRAGASVQSRYDVVATRVRRASRARG
jgi:single-strand DNA-binding protein